MRLYGYSICNETWGSTAGSQHNWPVVCGAARDAGYTGIEIAPFTFADDCRTLSSTDRRWIAKCASDAGLTITALHWLLVSPAGMHIHSSESSIRLKTVDYLKSLADLCVDVGADVMVLGSPGARKLDGLDHKGAVSRTIDTLCDVAVHLANTDVRICPEALPAPEADFLLTQQEAAALVLQCNHPNIGMMLDVKSMCSEAAGAAALVETYGDITCHLHANDANRRGPGFGSTDFTAIAKALKQTQFTGWISVEVFDYTPDPITIANESLRHLKSVFS